MSQGFSEKMPMPRLPTRLTAIALLALVVERPASAYDVPPSDQIETSGSVATDLSTGSFKGDVCLSGMPSAATRHFALNAGLNVARVTDGVGAAVPFHGWYSPGIDGEARIYEIDGAAPPKLCVSYVGSFPVYPAHDAPDDFKGVIAFNGDSVRAAEQAAWLPIAFDDTAKRRFNETAYDLQVDCAGCRFLYVNGAVPVERGSGRFVSTRAIPLLFGGTGPLTQTSSVTFVNEAVTAAESRALSDTFARIEAFYAGYVGRAVGDRPILLRMVTLDQTERDRKRSSWGFATWPTIALSGSIADYGRAILSPNSSNDWVLHHLAHETGHYYFGTVNDATGPYRWMLIESGAEFLSLEATAEIGGAAMAAHRRQVLIGQLNDEKSFRPLDTITDSEQIGSTYRYAYIPLLLLALEREVGRPAMKMFVRTLIGSVAPQNWADLRAIALRSGLQASAWDRWRTDCVDDAQLACVKTVG